MNLRNSVAYSSAVRLPPQPHDSFPTPQYLTQIGGEVRLRANESAEMHKLVRAELVRIVNLWAVGILSRIADPEVRAARAFTSRPNAIVPVVAVGKTSAWPTQHAGFDLPHLFDQRASDATDVGYLRFLADPNAVVDHAAEVL